jgi:hypothetical protein
MRRFTDGTDQDRIIISVRETTLDLLQYISNYVNQPDGWLLPEDKAKLDQFFEEAKQYRTARDKTGHKK